MRASSRAAGRSRERHDPAVVGLSQEVVEDPEQEGRAAVRSARGARGGTPWAESCVIRLSEARIRRGTARRLVSDASLPAGVARPVTDAAWSPDVCATRFARTREDADPHSMTWSVHPLDQPGPIPHPVSRGSRGLDALPSSVNAASWTSSTTTSRYLERSVEVAADFPRTIPPERLMVWQTGIGEPRPAGHRFAFIRERRRARQADRAKRSRRASRADVGQSGDDAGRPGAGLDDLWEESAAWLRGERDADGVWEQSLTASIIDIGARAWLRRLRAGARPRRIGRRAARPFAVERDGLVDWAALADGELVARDGAIRTQSCHGAPGSWHRSAASSTRTSRGPGLVGGADPLVKGANLCHGTAGNGYGFLALLATTGDERWLARARAFATRPRAGRARQHRSSEAGGTRYGPGIWDGPVLADCLEGRGQVPSGSAESPQRPLRVAPRPSERRPCERGASALERLPRSLSRAERRPLIVGGAAPGQQEN